MDWPFLYSLIPLIEAPVLETWSKGGKKSHPGRDLTDSCTSKNEIEPQHNWRRQTLGRVQSLPNSTCWRWHFFIGKLYFLPACTIASENMASSFKDFLAETFTSYSPDDSHLALETIFSCFYSSTCSWRVPAIYVVSISFLLASLGRGSTRPALESRACSFCVLHTAKRVRALLRSTAAVFITTKTDNGKKTSQGNSNTL